MVISTTKTGNTIILERKTGKPIFNIDYKKAPSSNLIGDFAWPFQIFLKKPERFSKIEYGKEDFNKLPEFKINEISQKLLDSKYGWFETPSFDYDLISFGLHGGAQWMGSSLDRLNNFYIYQLTQFLEIKALCSIQGDKNFFEKEYKNYHKLYLNKCSSCHGINRNGKNIKFKEKQIEYIPNLVGYYSIPGIKNKLTSITKINSKHKI